MFAINKCIDHFLAEGTPEENQIIKKYKFAFALRLIAREKQ